MSVTYLVLCRLLVVLYEPFIAAVSITHITTILLHLTHIATHIPAHITIQMIQSSYYYTTQTIYYHTNNTILILLHRRNTPPPPSSTLASCSDEPLIVSRFKFASVARASFDSSTYKDFFKKTKNCVGCQGVL